MQAGHMPPGSSSWPLGDRPETLSSGSGGEYLLPSFGSEQFQSPNCHYQTRNITKRKNSSMILSHKFWQNSSRIKIAKQWAKQQNITKIFAAFYAFSMSGALLPKLQQFTSDKDLIRHFGWPSSNKFFSATHPSLCFAKTVNWLKSSYQIKKHSKWLVFQHCCHDQLSKPF